MNGIKSPLGSLTINSSAIAVVVSLLEVAGIQIGPSTLGNVNAIVAGICGVIAIYGRIRATKKVVLAAAA